MQGFKYRAGIVTGIGEVCVSYQVKYWLYWCVSVVFSVPAEINVSL